MNTLRAFLVSFGLLPSLLVAQQEPVAEVFIPEPVRPVVPAETVPEPDPPIDYVVLSTRVARMDVVESPPMTGLPPVTGTINVTVRLVADPNLPEPPPPLPALPPDDPAVIAALEDLIARYKGTEILFVSATVYDRSRTFLRIIPNGKPDKEVAAWSNLDFNYFGGFSTFRVSQPDGTFTDFGMLMGIGNTDTVRWREAMEKHGLDHELPEAPELPDLAISGPSFVVADGDAEGMAMDTLKYLHELYRKEGGRMEAAYYARERARKERMEYFLANPPRPDDVTVSFWRREKTQATEEEGAR